MYDLIIIGAGPAGITAGIYAARDRLKTLLITKDFTGQLGRKAIDIENYPGFEKISGLDLVKKFESHLKKYKVATLQDEVVKVKKSKGIFSVKTEKKKEFQSRTVIVASGADPRPLEVPGEKDFIGRGVSYCTACDAPMFKNKAVAVIGGGNSGFEAAIALNKWAKKIYILEYGPKIIADKDNQEAVAKLKRVQILLNAQSKAIKGEQFVNSLVYQDRKTKKEKTLKVQGIFIEIGSQPATSFVKGIVDFNKKDEIIVNAKTGETSTPGLFTAGDVDDNPYNQIVIAAGEGAQAALSAAKYLNKSSAW